MNSNRFSGSGRGEGSSSDSDSLSSSSDCRNDCEQTKTRTALHHEFYRLFPLDRLRGGDPVVSMRLNMLVVAIEQTRVAARVVSPELRRCRASIFFCDEQLPLWRRFLDPVSPHQLPAESEPLRAGSESVRALEGTFYFLFKKQRDAIIDYFGADQRIIGVQLPNKTRPSPREVTHPLWLLKLALEKLRPRFYTTTQGKQPMPIEEPLTRIRDLLCASDWRSAPLNIVGMVHVLQELAGFDPAVSVGKNWPSLRRVLERYQAPCIAKVRRAVQAKRTSAAVAEEKEATEHMHEDLLSSPYPSPQEHNRPPISNISSEPSMLDTLLDEPVDVVRHLIDYVYALDRQPEEDKALLCLPLLLSDMERFAYSAAVQRMIFKVDATGAPVLDQRGEQQLTPRFKEICAKFEVLTDEELLIQLTPRSWHRVRHRGWLYNRLVDLLSSFPDGLFGFELQQLEHAVLKKAASSGFHTSRVAQQLVASAREAPLQGPLEREECLLLEHLRSPTA